MFSSKSRNSRYSSWPSLNPCLIIELTFSLTSSFPNIPFLTIKNSKKSVPCTSILIPLYSDISKERNWIPISFHFIASPLQSRPLYPQWWCAKGCLSLLSSPSSPWERYQLFRRPSLKILFYPWITPVHISLIPRLSPLSRIFRIRADLPIFSIPSSLSSFLSISSVGLIDITFCMFTR